LGFGFVVKDILDLKLLLPFLKLYSRRWLIDTIVTSYFQQADMEYIVYTYVRR
jgi:hypothetical protein